MVIALSNWNWGVSGAPSCRHKRPPKEAELEEQLTTKRRSSAGCDDGDAVGKEAAADAPAAAPVRHPAARRRIVSAARSQERWGDPRSSDQGGWSDWRSG